MSAQRELEMAAEQAAAWFHDADGLLVTAGAGMGVDSGLPDFRGEQGFWRAYPALGRRGTRFQDIASPDAFRRAPRLAWGFYGHRLNLYRQTTPHAGHDLLRSWGEGMPHGAFVYTSNVDGHFAKAGFAPDRIVECHGSIHVLQCLDACTTEPWDAGAWQPEVDETTCTATGLLPTCRHCGGLARPNILMFDDIDWLESRFLRQRALLNAWLAEVERPAIVELGAGTSIATVRQFGERQGRRLVRINPVDCTTPPHVGIGLQAPALAALQSIDRQFRHPRNRFGWPRLHLI